jgi:GNAT superfamily N-acetyltransferase
MTDQLEIEIIEGYRKELAAAMATMFNSWDDVWPGGFTEGVPYTPERVDKDFGSQRVVVQLIAWDKNTKEAVGYLSLLQHWRDREAAYIGLLGVSPKVLEKKVGKRLLLRSMAIATQQGFQRVDLHTWAGNLRAVPLYKKMGLMWDPESDGVYLQGFIPAILQHPLCASFVKAHDAFQDWYGLQQREIVQAPDHIEKDGMKIFTYSFQAEKDTLHVTVDRYARAISGVESIVNGQRLKVNTRVKNHLTLCGIPSKYILEVENGTEEPCSITIQLEGFTGLHFQGKTQYSLVVPPKERTAISVPFSLDSNAPLFRKDFKSPAITTALKINGEKAQLHTGLKVKPAAEIQTKFGNCRLVPGGKVAFPVTVQNNASIPFEGLIHFHVPDAPITVSPQGTNLKIKPEGPAGLTVNISADKQLNPGTYDLWASLHLKSTRSEKISLTTRKFRIPIFNISNGFVAVGEDDRQRRIIVTGRHYNALLAREGGSISIPSSAGLGGSLSLRSEVGPPFGLSPFRYAEQDVKIAQKSASTTISLSAEHFDKPLHIENRFIFDHHTPIIRQETWITNRGSTSHTFQLRLIGPGGVSLGTGKAVIPLASGIIKDRLSSFFASYPAIQSTPENFKEQWVAAELEAFTRGQVWDPNNLEESRVSMGRIIRLSYCPITLAPNEKQCLSRVWYIARVPNWNAVRKVWQENVALKIPLEDEETLPIETASIIKITGPPIIIPYRKKIQQDYRIQYIAAIPQTGQLVIEPPHGWTATISQGTEKNPNPSLMLENITSQNIPLLHLNLEPSNTIPDQFNIFKGQVVWKLPIEERQAFRIVQLGSSKDSIQISEEEDQNLSSYCINNGLLKFKVSSEYGGCLYSLKNSRGTELLSSAFPTPKPKVFIQNYYGGWQPFVSTIDEDFFQANTNQEKMRAKICKVNDIWQGIEIQWKGKIQSCSREVNFNLQYLTAPGSPLVLTNLKIRNPTTAALRLMTFQLLDPAFNGDSSNTILQTRWAGTLSDMRGFALPTAFMPDSNFAWFQQTPTKTKTTEGIAILNAQTTPSLFVFLTHEINWIISINDLYLHPKEEQTIQSALFVNPPNITQIEELQQILNTLLK